MTMVRTGLACLPLLLALGCAHSAAPEDSYTARGQEPGWSLTIADGRIDYVGNYGEKRISVPAPKPIIAFNGHIYQTARLQVHISHGRCNDAMSGQGFADQVMVIADGETYRGCGGPRRSEWDM